MYAELDHDLTPDQWEALKSLRRPVRTTRKSSRRILESLVALELAAISGDLAFITTKGRKVLIRGSSRLLDVAA